MSRSAKALDVALLKMPHGMLAFFFSLFSGALRLMSHLSTLLLLCLCYICSSLFRLGFSLLSLSLSVSRFCLYPCLCCHVSRFCLYTCLCLRPNLSFLSLSFRYFCPFLFLFLALFFLYLCLAPFSSPLFFSLSLQPPFLVVIPVSLL